MNSLKKIELGPATVTGRGLLFNGSVYTNANMIKYKWFEHAAIEGEWQIPILYQEQENDHLILFDIYANAIEVATTNQTEQSGSSDYVEKYQEKIRYLKKQIQKSNKT
ncbi:hypothetical protein [Paenibacillus prosopidis]|uniref:Uncharacterized protein n=1 Tax=Paenibacillus prosopidis TaxID=630520 RepID=A0A368VHH3_9BACL|nr:hypothetical protein [Paenibacillus prosopidis]RCW40585.1 hypothetical protein DFP97_13219 [Paenibacillus prosopidis]